MQAIPTKHPDIAACKKSQIAKLPTPQNNNHWAVLCFKHHFVSCQGNPAQCMRSFPDRCTLLDSFCENSTSGSLHPNCELLCQALASNSLVHSIRHLSCRAAGPALSPGIPQQGLQRQKSLGEGRCTTTSSTTRMLYAWKCLKWLLPCLRM